MCLMVEETRSGIVQFWLVTASFQTHRLSLHFDTSTFYISDDSTPEALAKCSTIANALVTSPLRSKNAFSYQVLTLGRNF